MLPSRAMQYKRETSGVWTQRAETKKHIIMFSSVAERVQAEMSEKSKKRQVLRELDCFVLDNSIRESTVGQLRGHTLENKWQIFEEVKKCGFKHIVVAAFSHMTRVDDHFIKQLVERGEDISTMYSFTECIDSIVDGRPEVNTLPVSLKKMKSLQLRNPIFEIDLADSRVDWKRFTVWHIQDLLLQRIDWVRKNLSRDAKIFVNIRDFPFAMTTVPERVLAVTQYLSSLPENTRPFGLMYEEPTGKSLPEQLGMWTAAMRDVMNSCGWRSGKLLTHIHEKWGLGEASVLECLRNGANGVWASICVEGAAVGHASSTLTLMNLVRLGNKRVLQRYNCTHLRSAAINVTKITTGLEPHPKQLVYGERALDMVLDVGATGGEEFDLPAFFGVQPPKRISTLASPGMVLDRLREVFGDEPQFTLTIATRMKEVMIEDLRQNRKEEYMSAVGLAVLFDRAGGSMTVAMRDTIEKVDIYQLYHKKLIDDVRHIWDTWDLSEAEELQGDECLEFDSFYNGFMAPYFGCFRCDDTRKGLAAIDMDSDGKVDWSEFLVYLKWALHQYPDIKDADELLSITFRKALIPAMQDELLE